MIKTQRNKSAESAPRLWRISPDASTCRWCGSTDVAVHLRRRTINLAILRCRACRTISPAVEHQKIDYGQYNRARLAADPAAQRIVKGYARADEARHLCDRFVKATIGRLSSEFRLIDVGCGPADFLAEVRRRFPQADLAGLDPSAANVEEAARQGVEIEQKFWEEPYPGGWDAITMFGNVMLHDDPLASLQLAYDRLANGGLLLFDVKNPASATRSLLRCAEPWMPASAAVDRIYLQSFHGMPWGLPAAQLRERVAGIGFDVIAVESFASRNAELGRRVGLAHRASNLLDRLSRREPWLQFTARKS